MSERRSGSFLEDFSALQDLPRDESLTLNDVNIRVETSLWLWRPEAADFRRDPRFAGWVKAVGLPEYWDRTSWPEACSRTESGEIRCR